MKDMRVSGIMKFRFVQIEYFSSLHPEPVPQPDSYSNHSTCTFHSIFDRTGLNSMHPIISSLYYATLPNGAYYSLKKKLYTHEEGSRSLQSDSIYDLAKPISRGLSIQMLPNICATQSFYLTHYQHLLNEGIRFIINSTLLTNSKSFQGTPLDLWLLIFDLSRSNFHPSPMRCLFEFYFCPLASLPLHLPLDILCLTYDLSLFTCGLSSLNLWLLISYLWHLISDIWSLTWDLCPFSRSYLKN